MHFEPFEGEFKGYSLPSTWVLIIILGIATEYVLLMFLFTVRARKNAFTREFMD